MEGQVHDISLRHRPCSTLWLRSMLPDKQLKHCISGFSEDPCPLSIRTIARSLMKGVWKAAGKPYIPSQKLLQQEFKLLIQCVTTPPSEPFHHVVFALGYKDRVKLTKSKSRGHPARYWFELVFKEAVRFLNHYLDYHALTGRRDFLGIKQMLQKRPEVW